MRSLKKLTRTLAVIVAAGAAISLGWLLADDHRNQLRKHEKVSRELAADLGSRIGSLVAAENTAAIADEARAWLQDHSQAVSVNATDLNGAVHATEHSDSSIPVEVTEVSILRDGKPWGTVQLGLVGPNDFISIAGRSITKIPFIAWSGVFILVSLTVASKRRSNGMGYAWQEARERVESTLDFLAEGVLVIDPAGRLVFLNAPMRQMLSKHNRETNIRNLEWSATASEQALPESWWEKESLQQTVILRSPNGEQRVFVVSSLAVRRGGKALGHLLTFNDVTALEESRRDLALATVAAEKANQAKGVFLANMSHEIRTPITGVLGSLELLEQTALTQTQNRYLDAAQVSAGTLLHLINDIIDLSRIEAGRIELEETTFYIEECFTSALKIVAEAAATKGLELTLKISREMPAQVVGDSGRLRQVVLNLVSNAVKFTAKGGVYVEAIVEWLHDEAVGVRVNVRDTGIGIPPEKIQRLFKMFSQADASTVRRFGGSGLGLAISRQLCELMGGNVNVESHEGQGSTFSCWVKLRKAEAAATKPYISRLKGRQSVVIDSREHSRDAFVDLCGRAGLDMCDREKLITWDNTPEDRRPVVLVGGAKFSEQLAADARQIKEQTGGRAIVVAVLSCDVTPDTERQHAEIVDGWLRAPASVKALEECVLDSVDGPQENAAAAETTSWTGVKVLIAEDHPITQMITSEAVKAAGCTFELAETGHSALKAALSGEFGIALMDCHLPDVDGLEITRRVREAEKADPTKPRLVIIALTASAMSEDRGRCLAAGMDGYLSKPIRRDMLIKELRERCSQQNPSLEIEPVASTPDSSATTRVIDMTELADRCFGNPEMIKEMLDLFVSTTAADIQKLSNAVDRAAVQDVHELAHRIAGGALQVCANDLAETARRLEKTPENNVEYDSVCKAFSIFKEAASTYQPPSDRKAA